MAERVDDCFRLPAPSKVNSNAILRSFIAENPLASADVMALLTWLEDLPGRLDTGRGSELPSPLRRRFLRETLALAAIRSDLSAALAAAVAGSGKDMTRILVLAPDAEAILDPLVALGRSGAVCLGICGPDASQRTHLLNSLPEGVVAVEIDTGEAPGALSMQWDVLVLAVLQPLDLAWGDMVAAATQHVQHQGLILAAAPVPDALLCWLLDVVPPEPESVSTVLAGVGLRPFGETSEAGLVSARPGPRRLVPPRQGERAGPIFRCDVGSAVAGMLLDLRTAITTADGASSPRLWCLCATDDDAVAEAVAAFLRVARLEHPRLDLRFVRCGMISPDDEALTAMLEAAPEGEEELDLRAAPRLRRLLRRPVPQRALRLDTARLATRPGWEGFEPPSPGRGEIAVAVEAIGLNFRDLMLVSGLLPVDLFTGGLAGASVGIEFAGVVTALGEGVAGLRPGTRVSGVARAAFATHVVARASDVSPVPDGIAPEAAAGLSVAFLTAWYGLVELARLRASERVLVHAGAGGVGLAAIQIARLRGARVIATASTPAKRALARAHGADATFDSRSLSFCDDIRARFGGVDVVINSLAGDAMQESLRLLVPFGRFVELGKRDFAENRAVGLRPLRENISYFGVDLDQLLRHRPEVVKRGLAFIMKAFRNGSLTPLPVSAFAADEVAQAFDSMRKGSHVGKIVICPPVTEGSGPTFAVDPEGVQLVIGGTRGFGLETAIWLAERGGRRIVVASRSATLDPAQAHRVEALRAHGVTFLVETVDVADAASVNALVSRVTAALGAITGVVQSALHLEDGLISGIAGEALSRVLAPKVAGVHHLLHAVADQPLRFFVVYSSAAAVLGNAGQGAYAAANGYLAGIARMARRTGTPCLSVAWGPILDAGIVARQAAARTLKAIASPAQEALAVLGALLAKIENLPPAVAYADLAGALALMPRGYPRSRRLAFAVRSQERAAAVLPDELLQSVTAMPEAEALALIRDGVIAELARILRTTPEAIDPQRPLDQLGMDSLMIMEFKLAFEARFGVELPFVSISAFRNPEDMVRRILQQMRGGNPAAQTGLSPDERRLLETHRAGSSLANAAEPAA